MGVTWAVGVLQVVTSHLEIPVFGACLGETKRELSDLNEGYGNVNIVFFFFIASHV